MKSARGAETDNAGLRRLDSSNFVALLQPIPDPHLRRIVKQGELGRRLQREYFKGFRVETMPRESLLARLEEATRRMHGTELATSLLQAWLREVPAAVAISRDVLERDDPFGGPMTTEFYERLAIAAPPASIEALRAAFPPLGEDRGKPIDIHGMGEAVAGGSRDAVAAGAPSATADIPVVIRSSVAHNGDTTSEGGLEGTELTGGPTAASGLPSLEELRQRFTAPTGPFDSVVERDHWLWSNMSTPLLTPEDVNARLADLPEPDASRYGTEQPWVDYADQSRDGP